MRALILTHAEHEGPGLVGAALAAAGARVDERALGAGAALPDSPAGYQAVIAMGGAMAAWDDANFPFLDGEARLLAAAARGGAAVLGVCLGAQLLARGLGARLWRGPAPEIGVAPIFATDEGRADPLLAPLDGCAVLHWHEDSFDLPPGAVRLASSPGYANQAYRVGARAYGVQFHIECDTAMRRQWAELGADELRARGADAPSLWAPATAPLDERGRAFARAFLALASGGSL
jgi:GMP synthase-like glutamine amidotransferase